jgi:hypothetical protein
MSPFRNWKTRRWILKPKGISKQAEKVSVKGGGRHARGCQSLGGDDEEDTVPGLYGSRPTLSSAPANSLAAMLKFPFHIAQAILPFVFVLVMTRFEFFPVRSRLHSTASL